ncbi:MAG: dUTP diphosphatase, partial [Patescibacteria group bacterium]|nr:dUTP diphosphatase [Patescibacteria group bacterium]
MKLKFKKLSADSKNPSYAHTSDAGFDLYCTQDLEIKPHERKSVSTGIAIEIPYGYVGLIWDKSGLSQKFGLKVFGGVIDSGYRGEILVGLMNLSDTVFKFEKGHKIAQLLIQKIETADFEEVEELSGSDRGGNGFG